jgi:hypothetical protein
LSISLHSAIENVLNQFHFGSLTKNLSIAPVSGPPDRASPVPLTAPTGMVSDMSVLIHKRLLFEFAQSSAGVPSHGSKARDSFRQTEN